MKTAQADSGETEHLPPSCVADPPGVHLAHITHSDDAHDCVAHVGGWRASRSACVCAARGMWPAVASVLCAGVLMGEKQMGEEMQEVAAFHSVAKEKRRCSDASRKLSFNLRKARLLAGLRHALSILPTRRPRLRRSDFFFSRTTSAISNTTTPVVQHRRNGPQESPRPRPPGECLPRSSGP